MNKHAVLTFVPVMDDFNLTVYENDKQRLMPAVTRNIEQAMVEAEMEIKRTLSVDDAVAAMFTLAAFAERFHQLERIALAHAESLNPTRGAA